MKNSIMENWNDVNMYKSIMTDINSEIVDEMHKTTKRQLWHKGERNDARIAMLTAKYSDVKTLYNIALVNAQSNARQADIDDGMNAFAINCKYCAGKMIKPETMDVRKVLWMPKRNDFSQSIMYDCFNGQIAEFKRILDHDVKDFTNIDKDVMSKIITTGNKILEILTDECKINKINLKRYNVSPIVTTLGKMKIEYERDEQIKNGTMFHFESNGTANIKKYFILLIGNVINGFAIPRTVKSNIRNDTTIAKLAEKAKAEKAKAESKAVHDAENKASETFKKTA